MPRPWWTAAFLAIAAAVPLVAEIWTATPEHVPGTGFSVLLYYPFDFAYVLLVAVSTAFLNGAGAEPVLPARMRGVGLSLLAVLAWFVVIFLAVGGLHMSLGGQFP